MENIQGHLFNNMPVTMENSLSDLINRSFFREQMIMKQFEGISGGTVSSSVPFLGIVVQLAKAYQIALMRRCPVCLLCPLTSAVFALRAGLLPYATAPLHLAWFVWPLAQRPAKSHVATVPGGCSCPAHSRSWESRHYVECSIHRYHGAH